jgi:hypothetical protein
VTVSQRRAILAGLTIALVIFSRKRLVEDAKETGESLAAALPIVASAASEPELPDEPDAEVAAVTDADESTGPLADKGSVPRSRAKHPIRKSGGGIFVDATTVLRLANSGVVPDGRLVPARASHPAGISLLNVSALGVGLHDGDVLTEVEGQPVRSKSQVVALVLVGRQRHVPTMSGVFYRDGAPWRLTVEMPY